MTIYYYYVCDKCRFSPFTIEHPIRGKLIMFQSSGYKYAADDAGNRIVCRHPNEFEYIKKVLGERWSELEQERTGFINHCLCLDCLANLEIDLERDEKLCSNCKSNHIVSVSALDGTTCPKCKQGTIKKFEGPIS